MVSIQHPDVRTLDAGATSERARRRMVIVKETEIWLLEHLEEGPLPAAAWVRVYAIGCKIADPHPEDQIPGSPDEKRQSFYDAFSRHVGPYDGSNDRVVVAHLVGPPEKGEEVSHRRGDGTSAARAAHSMRAWGGSV
ncbi:MAG: hypothetical protein JWM10_733 [Myxococcaceae bacterium]|nr:hypothetical protein [Myxococcaceae bacterium]